MKCLVVLAMVALVVAEPPTSGKDSVPSETKDKRGAVTYGTTSDYSSGHGAAAVHALPAAGLGYSGLAASPLLLSGAQLGAQLGGLHGLGLQAPIGYAGLGGLHGGLGLGYSGLGLAGHGLAAQPLVLGSGLGLGSLGGYSGLAGLSAYSGLSHGLVSAAPAAAIYSKPVLSSYSVPETISSGSYLSAPSKTYGVPSQSYGVPSQSSYSSAFTPITSSYASPSYSSPSSSYGVPSASYSVPSSSYGVPASSYSAPSSSYGAPSSSYSSPSSASASDSYSTLSYSGSRDYRSSH